MVNREPRPPGRNRKKERVLKFIFISAQTSDTHPRPSQPLADASFPRYLHDFYPTRSGSIGHSLNARVFKNLICRYTVGKHSQRQFFRVLLGFYSFSFWSLSCRIRCPPPLPLNQWKTNRKTEQTMRLDKRSTAVPYVAGFDWIDKLLFFTGFMFYLESATHSSKRKTRNWRLKQPTKLRKASSADSGTAPQRNKPQTWGLKKGRPN